MKKGQQIQNFIDNKPMPREEYYQAVEEFQRAIATQSRIMWIRSLWIQRLIAIIAVLVTFNVVYFFIY